MRRDFYMFVPKNFRGDLENEIWENIGDVYKFDSIEEAEEMREHLSDVADDDTIVKVSIDINTLW